jgi:MoxR-like ATPase
MMSKDATLEQRPATAFAEVLERLDQVVLGKERQLQLALTCLLAQGHLLIEDLPGLGKTVLANALGVVLGMGYQRVQFTSDLLPGDIIGSSIYDRNRGEFRFVDGPVFTQLLLADEINRATPKCQSALLEAMEERQVSVEGRPRALPRPFFVIATQNPSEQSGTFPLPESQLDRFLMCISMGYPSREAELDLFRGEDRRRMLEKLAPVLTPEKLIELQERVGEVRASDAVLDYLHWILDFTRNAELFQTGLSTRAGLGLLRAAKAWALLHGEERLLPGDIQAVLPTVAGHRLVTTAGRMTASGIAAEIIARVDVD